jgi:hypothetical protein
MADLSTPARPPTVTVPTLDHGPVTLPEPVWCTGHTGPAGYRADVAHTGPETGLAIATPRGPVTILSTSLTAYPYGNAPDDPRPFLSVDLGASTAPFTPDGLRDLADELTGYADWLRIRAHQLAAVISTGEAGRP